MLRESTNTPLLITKNSHKAKVFDPRPCSIDQFPSINKRTAELLPRNQCSVLPASPASPASSLSTLTDVSTYVSDSSSGPSLFSSPGCFGKQRYRTSPTLKIPSNKDDSFHFILPLETIQKAYMFVKRIADYDCRELINRFEGVSDSFLNCMSMFYINCFLIFGIEMLKLSKYLFFCGIVLLYLASYNIWISEDIYIFVRGSTMNWLNNRSTLELSTKSGISFIILSFQMFSVFSVYKMASVLKVQYMDIESKLDRLSLFLLLGYMIFVCFNLCQHSIHGVLHYTTEDMYFKMN